MRHIVGSTNLNELTPPNSPPLPLTRPKLWAIFMDERTYVATICVHTQEWKLEPAPEN